MIMDQIFCISVLILNTQMTTLDKILHLFENHKDLTVKEIVTRLDVSNQMVHISIKNF